MLISRSCPLAPMKRGGRKIGGSKTEAVLCPKRGGAVVSQLVPKLKESVPPLPPPPPSRATRLVVLNLDDPIQFDTVLKRYALMLLADK